MTSKSRMKKMATSIGNDCIAFLRLVGCKSLIPHEMVDSRPWQRLARQPWLLGIVSAALLLLPFSIIGPVPFWRTFFAWLAFVPLFCGLLSKQNLRPSQGVAARNPGCLSHGLSLVCRQLLLDLPDHAVLRRPAATHFGRHSDCLQHGAGALLRRPRLVANRYSTARSAAPITRFWPRPFSG